MDCGRYGVTALLFLMASLGLAQAYEVMSVDREVMEAEGKDIELECFVEGEDFNPMKTPILFMKGEDRYSINNNEMIVEPFADTGRYKVELKGNKYNQGTLTITGVTAAENDKFFCVIGSDTQVTYTVTIPESIEEVSMTTNTSVVDPESGEKVFKFQADKPSFVHCDVKGGRPEPVVSILRDGPEEEDSVDITDSFDIEKVPVSDRSEGEALEVTRYQVSLKNDDFKILTEYNGHRLTCTANVQINKTRAKELGITKLKQTDSAEMEITYTPKIECATEKETVEGTKQFRIECVVKANPKINMHEIMWSFINEGENETTTIKHVMNQEYEEGQYDTMAEVNDETEAVTVSFEIKNVNSSDFKVYTLQVENDLGKEEHNIHVFRKTTTQSTTTEIPKEDELKAASDNENGATNTVATVFSLVLSIVLAAIL